MLGSEFIILAVSLRLFGNVDYIWETIKRHVAPSPVTWFLWGCTNLIAFIAQIQKGFEPSAWATFALCVGPFTIFGITLVQRANLHLKKFDVFCGAFSIIGIIAWIVTSNPLAALIFSIIGDAFAGMPTIRKAYATPGTERAMPYFLTVLSMIVALMTVKQWEFMHYAFPVYIAIINSAILVALLIGSYKNRGVVDA